MRLLVAVLLTLAALGLPARAEARKRVVVLEVDGPGGDRITRQLDLLIQRRHATVTAARFARTARELKAQRPTDRNIARVARHLAIDGVVVGEVSERDDSYRLTVRLREGKTGTFVQTIAVRLESPELTRAAARQIWRMLMPAIDGLPSVAIVELDDGGGGSTTPPPPEDLDFAADEPAGGAPPAQEAPPADEPAEAPMPGEDHENPLARPADTHAAPPASAELDSGLSPVELHVGLSVSNRSLRFAHEPNLDDPPQGYAGAVVPGAYANAELYPLALSNGGALSGIGITAMIDHVLRIESNVRYEGTVTPLPTSQSRAGAGLVYRHAFAPGGGGLVVKASARLNKLSFQIDREPSPIDIDVPNVDYTFLDPGLSARYPIGPLAVYGEARAMLIFTTGEIQQIDQYGTADMLGLDLDAGVEYAVTDRIAARGGFRFTGISYTFAGDGALTDRGGGAAIDVVGAHDRYVGGYLVGVVSF